MARKIVINDLGAAMEDEPKRNRVARKKMKAEIKAVECGAYKLNRRGDRVKLVGNLWKHWDRATSQFGRNAISFMILGDVGSLRVAFRCTVHPEEPASKCKYLLPKRSKQ